MNLRKDKQMKNDKYPVIDFTRMFFCVCIICLHTNGLDFMPATEEKLIIQGVFRLAVPFFFVVSGFFLSKKLERRPEFASNILKKYIKKLIIPLMIFEALNVLLNTIKYILTVEVCNWNYWVIDNIKHFFFYPYGAMWYVQASIIGALLMYPFWKKNRMHIALIIGLILYGFALIGNNYWFLIVQTPIENVVRRYKDICISSRNGVFVGFMYITIGWFCAKYEDNFKKISKKNKWIIYGIALFLYVVEIFCLWDKPSIDDGALYLTHILVIPLLVLGLLKFKGKQDSTEPLRKLSTEMYFLHRAVLVTLEIIFIIINITYPGYVNFILVLSICMLLCILKETGRRILGAIIWKLKKQKLD